MADLKEFRRMNRLTQKAVADMLGVKRSYISQIETGVVRLPQKYVDTLQAIPGLECSALVDVKEDDLISQLASLRAENDYLRSRIESLQEDKDKYWELIQKMMK